ncbi:hypothetical protein SHKM778_81170 [Streptomyces sp. KM77-8]|uniref:GIY-YIG nuclease family protein n=1 Tax=Streptomyces haneummycinicus TaxID=3074435 RepID=A0AAT9HW04_9ACTN
MVRPDAAAGSRATTADTSAGNRATGTSTGNRATGASTGNRATGASTGSDATGTSTGSRATGASAGNRATGAARVGTSATAQRREPATTPSTASDTVNGTYLAAYALGTGRGFVLGVASPTAPRRPHHRLRRGRPSLLLTGRHRSGTTTAHSSALVRLLLGTPPEKVASLLGGERWHVVHARPDGETAPDPWPPPPSPPLSAPP